MFMCSLVQDEVKFTMRTLLKTRIYDQKLKLNGARFFFFKELFIKKNGCFINTLLLKSG